MKIKAIILWDKYTRLLHWSLALATLFLVLSGWLMGQVVADIGFWVEWHLMVGQVVLILLLLRLVLLFKRGNSHYSRFIVTLNDWPKIKGTLLFYLSLARSELPSWFAVNPFWRLLYILFYMLLVMSVFSGLVEKNNLLLGIYWPSFHAAVAVLINVWVFAHVLAVFLHDWKSTVSRVSAMISGVAYFENNTAQNDNEVIIKTNFQPINKKP